MTLSPAEVPNCEKCGQATILMTFIERFGDKPAYLVFDCRACNILTWIAEKVTDKN